MKIRNIIYLLSLTLLASCFKDETTHATGAISEISIIEGSVKDVYDIDKNETLVITPRVAQTNKEKKVTFIWEVEQEIHSIAPQFIYEGKDLGSYTCRLIVENEDGRTFFPFTLNVNSPYEEGITVLSHDENGKSMLSFMLKQREEGVKDFFVEGDCFALNNPEYQFAEHAVDIVQCRKTLIVACQGNEQTGQPGTIYYLNAKTLVVENVLSAPEYPDFRPYKLIIPENVYAGTAYPILCKNGKVYEFSEFEGAIAQPTKFKSVYSLSSILYDSGSSMYNNVYLWESATKNLWMLYNSYGPYFMSENHLNKVVDEKEATNYIETALNGKDPGDMVFMFLPRTPGKTSPYSDQIIMVTKKGAMYYRLKVANGYWSYNAEEGENILSVYDGFKTIGFSTDMTATSPYVATTLYGNMYYAKGNTIKRWNYSLDMHLQQAQKHATVGSADAVITAMELSPNHEETYVAFYEPNESGMNGHLWVLSTEDGKLLRQYDNICYRPTKVIYKKR